MLKDFKKIKDILNNRLLGGSLVFFVGTMTVSAGNYFFHFLMGRMLGPSQYGVLESLLSLMSLLGIPMATLTLVIVKYVSEFHGKKQKGTTGKFFRRLNEFFLKYGLIGFIIFILFMSPINSFLHLNSVSLVFIVGLITFISFFPGINRSFLQGTLQFKPYSTGSVAEVIFKLILAVVLVILGFKVMGAMAAILFSVLLGYLISRWQVREEVAEVDLRQNIGRKGLFYYTLPTFISILAFTSLYTADVILARHFLPAVQAGYYAALSVLGKIIYFTAVPISSVMFPLVSEHHSNGRAYRHLFLQSFGLTSFFCLAISLVYLLFPGLMIMILFGANYLAAASYLSLFAGIMVFYSLSNLVTTFFLSTRKVRAVLLPVVLALGQVGLILIFHQSLSSIALSSLAANFLLFISLMVYYLRYER